MTMKSKNCKDYWTDLNDHALNDLHTFVVNLEVFKIARRTY